MTAVGKGPSFATRDLMNTTLPDGKIGKTSANSILSDLNNLSQKSDSQSSGPLFVEDDSLEFDELDTSSSLVVNGKASMNKDLENGKELTSESSVKVKGTEESLRNTDNKHENEQNCKDNVAHSPQLNEGSEFPGGTLKGELVKKCNLSKNISEDSCGTVKTENIPDSIGDGHSNPVKTNKISRQSSLCSDDSNSNSNSCEKEPINKNNVSVSSKGSVKSVPRKLSVQSNSGRDSGCSSPKVSDKGNLFENMALESLNHENPTDTAEESLSATEEKGGKEEKSNSGGNNDTSDDCEMTLLTDKEGLENTGHVDSDVDDSILDDPETEVKYTGKAIENECKSRDIKIEENSVKLTSQDTDKDDKSQSIPTEKSVNGDNINVRNDDITCNTDISENTEAIKNQLVKDEPVDNKTDLDDERKSKKVDTGGTKRSLSPINQSAPKRSKLEEMIGRLSSSVGKKPEEVESMDEEESDSSLDSGEDESSSESEKITLTSKELNRVIRKRMEAFIKDTQIKVQKKIHDLQLNIEAWKARAAEHQKQIDALSVNNSPRSDRRRHSLKTTRNFGQQVDETKVQAALYQKGTSSGGKSTPRSPTTPTRTTTSNTASQNVVTFRNSQVRAIAPHPNKGQTVRNLLDSQKTVIGGIATAGTTALSTRPSNSSKAAKQLGGCIDLTDDDERSPPKTAAAVVRTVLQQNQLLGPVVQGTTATGTTTLRPGTVLLQSTPTAPGGPVVFQQVTQGIRLGQPTNAVMYASGTSNTLVKGAVTMSGPIPQLRAGQQVLVQGPGSTSTVSRPPPPLKIAPAAQKHPAPLPPTPASAGTYPKQPPPKPTLKISRVQQGIVLSWNMTIGKMHAEITNYQLFAYQETSASPSTNLWKKVGDVKALPLPMACTLTQFQEGNKYHFAVRAIDAHNRIGPFSDASSIHLVAAS